VVAEPPALESRLGRAVRWPWQTPSPPLSAQLEPHQSARTPPCGLHIGCLNWADWLPNKGHTSRGGADGPAVVWADPGVLLSSHWYGLNVDNSMPDVTAADVATWALRVMGKQYTQGWLVEEDVSWTQRKGLCRFVQRYESRDDDLLTTEIFKPAPNHTWVWWRPAAMLWPPEHQAGSMSVLLRASNRLMDAMANFTLSHERFAFLEVMFTSVASAAGLKSGSFNRSDALKLKCCQPFTMQSLPPNDTDAVVHPWKQSSHLFQSPALLPPRSCIPMGMATTCTIAIICALFSAIIGLVRRGCAERVRLST
jgi:hypothetical protein